MDPMETVAGEFPDTTYIHISGYKSNTTNFGNLFGAMEDMKYLPGCSPDRVPGWTGTQIGYMATFPSRGDPACNAIALGMKKTAQSVPWMYVGSTLA